MAWANKECNKLPKENEGTKKNAISMFNIKNEIVGLPNKLVHEKLHHIPWVENQFASSCNTMSIHGYMALAGVDFKPFQTALGYRDLLVKR